MSEFRLLFVKEGRASYISHLDLLRTFQRVFIRSGMVIRHSGGFHPHPIMSFVLPLSVGQCSDYEMLDFETVEEISCEGMADRLNPFMPEGVRILDCRNPAKPVRDMAFLRADVTMIYDDGVPVDAAEAIKALLLADEVIVTKRNKKKQMVDVDIRAAIDTVEIEEGKGKLILHVVVQAQNPGVNPALLAAAVERHLPQFAPDFVQVRRLALLDEEKKLFY